MRRRVLSVGRKKLESLPVVFVNKENGSLTIVENGKWDTSTYPKNVFEPIGIVVIPTDHGVLKDGTGNVNQCGVMSIVPMSCTTPEKGDTTEDNHMYWGNYAVDISDKIDGLGRYDSVSDGLLNYKHVVITENNTSNNANGYSDDSGGIIPIQRIVGGYAVRYVSNVTDYVPSPYIGEGYNSGDYNESYGLKEGVVESEENNALSDFKGIVNTKIITDLATAQSAWRTANKIVDDYYGMYFPAACCCARFKTTGTKAFVDCSNEELKNGTGFWYLPAAGELGYILTRYADIKDTIKKLIDSYGVGVNLDSKYGGNANNYWSSTEFNTRKSFIIGTLLGDVAILDKDGWGPTARAFMRL